MNNLPAYLTEACRLRRAGHTTALLEQDCILLVRDLRTRDTINREYPQHRARIVAITEDPHVILGYAKPIYLDNSLYYDLAENANRVAILEKWLEKREKIIHDQKDMLDEAKTTIRFFADQKTKANWTASFFGATTLLLLTIITYLLVTS